VDAVAAEATTPDIGWRPYVPWKTGLGDLPVGMMRNMKKGEHSNDEGRFDDFKTL
jgi:hypothetical protein